MKTLDLVNSLRVHGPLPAARLAEILRTSRPTLSRTARSAGDQIIVRGNARRTRYAARRALRGSLSPIPIFRVDESGIPHEIAQLNLAYPDASAVDFETPFAWPLDDSMRDGWFEGLPYPIQDMRPQGFLGKNFARHHAAILQVNENPQTWSDDDVLHVLSLQGVDTPGDLIVGEAACRAWLQHVQSGATSLRNGLPDGLRDGLDDGDIANAYPALASQALSLGVEGSSAGGEFPKFTAMRRRADGSSQHVIVKFSGSDASPGARRWSDLLICEHIAAEIVRNTLGIASARTRIYRFDGRVFLEVDRFDRHGSLGRSPMVSWATLNHAFLGTAGRPWFEGAREIEAKGWLLPEGVESIRLAWHFGQLIGNTDMHDGNLSFVPQTADGSASFRIAPIYDMLPMLYAPARGVEVPARDFAPRLPLPADRDVWTQAAGAAIHFWQTVGSDDRINDDFKAVAVANTAILTETLSATLTTMAR